MRYKQWKIAHPSPEGRAQLERAGIPSLLACVLSARGVTEPEQAWKLLTPGEEPLLDPMLLKDMDRAVLRVGRALKTGELMAVYGDYDVDGITSTCLLTDCLTRLGGRVRSYIPDRLEEGYGLNEEAVLHLAQQGVTLIITVDCGITAAREVEFARELGIDVVITDHHECKQAIPEAAAVVDPHRPDCPYPFKGLAGVGVALKLAMAAAGPDRAGLVFREYADLAAVGTVADVMPMTGENRTIVQTGLAALAHPRRVGLAQLMEEAGLGDKPVTSVSIGYTLAPRINAAGRMGQADLAAELLLTRDPGRAAALAQELCALNRERQTIECEIFQECVQRLERRPQSGIILLADEHWHQGVVGIVASRLTEKYSCPAFMVCLDQGMGKGSCRSWGGVNLFHLLTQCQDLLEGFGGHAMAAGFTVREENIPALERRLRQLVLEERAGEELPSLLEIDAAVLPQELTVEAVEALDALEPCGAGNPRPVLVLTGVHVISAAQVGRGRHLKLRLEGRGVPLDAIFFSVDGSELGLTPGCRVDVAFYPQINDFRGVRSVQLQVVDLRHAMTRAQLEQSIYEKYRRGEPLSPQEAQSLLPTRAEFVCLWRYLERQCAGQTFLEDTLARIAQKSARSGGQSERPNHTLVCLEVMEERGLISLERQSGRVQITLHRLEHKVDLNASAILRRLREAMQET
ncbi:single-stranded-DNA-specific exonuclease RecJ [Pseudoflavonifractor capillosus]|uniref:single-stranded-DNA-specific exonuclease RecJ n=1 Tax=Pseudoflavonifractor capillosus TaxID=106588 RepID=UPI0019565309|nr:single-stranded-DNA-specific exonuclease RecJ [Pseudoflavonifractor capillosus]MBM6679698.1 single-stranded-DNA-specific exonuclease RecJ [Pseudoflavonifractor capillosus]